MTVETWDEFEAWLETQDTRMCALIAARASARLLLFALNADRLDEHQRFKLLLAFRAVLSASLVAKYWTPEARDAARLAFAPSDFFNAQPASAFEISGKIVAGTWLTTIGSAKSCLEAALAEEDADAFIGAMDVFACEPPDDNYFEDPSLRSFAIVDAGNAFDDLLAMPLFLEPAPFGPIFPQALGFRKFFEAGRSWSFWLRWYQGWLTGQHIDWDLQYRIATEIKDDVWEAGVDEVALAILQIERDFRTGIGPRLRRNKDGLWDVEDDIDIETEPVDFAIGQVHVALEAALASTQGNGINETSNETLLCRKAFEKRENPSVVATQFWNACMGMEKAIREGWYPDDNAHVGLRNTLYTSVEVLCEQDDLIRDRIGKLAALQPRRDATADEREDLSRVPDMMRGEMTKAAQAELEEAVEIATKTDKPPRTYRAKLVNWLNTLGQGVDQGIKHEKRANWLIKLAARIAGWFFDETEEVAPPDLDAED